MPELPEVEIEIARGLIADQALRRRIADVTDVDPFTCRPHTPAELRGALLPARHPGGTCPRCGAEMKHATVGGRSTWWCSREQTR